ncbi:hypothetical protein B7P43_G10458 [Cryptotermes secundus]|uniref:DNA/RNA non-specific endonuclease/pyrophosphatase/phosphodiesterase domain-containing protein n=3 Tax=Cryptotermes secundus TaxID=105785 RepID=A0A2J7RLB2_9NEOP|nr:hypothetical protein B7P43_G10458 [Cryptotermes secundus]
MVDLQATGGVITILIILGIYVVQGESECIVNVGSDLQYKSPLLISPDDEIVLDGSRFVLPTKASRRVSLQEGEGVELWCPGNSNQLNISGTTRDFKETSITCNSGIDFEFRGASAPITEFQCTDVPQSTIREVGTCSSGHRRLQIGYETSFGKFVRLIDICFDDTNYRASYVNYTLVDGIEIRQNFQQVSNLNQDDYFTGLPDSPDMYYTCSNQRRVIGKLVGSSRVGQFITCSNNINYLVEAHLATPLDFVYVAQQRSTQYHVNVVPMWRSIRHGNWIKLEEEIRKYASNTSREDSHVTVYSGTLGVTAIGSRNLFLGRHNNGNDVLPVPKWIWKLVYEPSTQEGIVFLVVNNPYTLSFTCSCVCAQTKWTLAWNRRDKSSGYVYCCSVDNFRRVFSGLPDFEVTGLLTKNRPYTRVFPDIRAE